MANTINSTNNLTSTKIPELYIRYFNPKQKINEKISIKYYVSDSTQAEYLNKDDSKTFTTIVKINNKSYTKTTKAGEYSIDIGSVATTGETYFSIYTIDGNGVASIEQFFDILIIDDTYPITQSQTYTMTSTDLSTYNIKVGSSVSINDAKLNGASLTNLFKGVKNKGYRKIIMLDNMYMLDYHGDKVTLPDQFTVDMNGATFKATQCNDINVSNLVDLRDCFDSHVINGNLVGNYDGFDFEATKNNTNYNIPGEGLAVAEINGARYSSFKNMNMSHSVGYNLGVFGGKKSGYIGTPGKLAFKNQYYIDNNGNQVNSSNMCTTDIIDISTLLDRGELQCSVYLGYGGLALNKAELFMHFYGNSQNYLKTIKTRQYQVVKIPSGAKYIRITGFTSVTESSGLTICCTGQATNCELININSYNTRTCAMHPGIYNHLLIKNCTFDKVADENEYKVTKLALDFEDGYENGRNLFFINNEVYEGTSALTIQRGFNCNVIKCRNFGLDLRGHIKGGNIKNNFFNDGSIYTTSFDSQSHLKLDNNTFFKTLKFLKWDNNGNYSTIGLTKLDCKQNYQNNSNINVIIDKAVENGSGGGTTPTTLTISNIANITQTANTEFYIQYSTNKAVIKHEVSWDGGNMFYDKTSDVTSSGTNYKFKHDSSGNAGTYKMAIRVTTSNGETVTSNVFTVTLEDNTSNIYTITNNLTYCTTNNKAQHIDANTKYSATITANAGYKLSTITVTMGGSDVTSSVVNNNTITINSVTGNIVITAKAIEQSTPSQTIGNMTNGKGVNQTTHIINDNADCWATINPVTVEKGATYTLQMDATWVWGYAYDDSDNYVSELFTSTGNNNYTYTFTAPTTKIRYGCYDPGKYLTYCNLTKTSGGTTTLTISNIADITQTAQTEFYIQYSTNIAVAKHEVSWDGGNTFYDKTSDVVVNGTSYKFKHDNKASAGTYRMAIRVTTANGTTKTSNVFTVTLTSTSTPTPVYELADTVFDGSSKYVDTGVKPFKTASDYTIFVDFDDYGASQGQQPYLFHCAYENADGDGLKVYYNNEDNHYYIIGNRQNASDGTYESSWTLVGGKNNKIAIAISKGVVSQIVINGSAVAVTKNAYDMNDYSLILGAYQDAQCNKSKYWKGTIHTFKVWNSAFTVAQLKELCNSSSGGGSNPGGSSDAYRPGRTLIWEDDFTGTSLNTANWDYENNYSRPNEVQNYVAGTNNVWVENSNLVIKAKKESSNGKEWSSGCIHTDNKREFMYGRFEAKIKIPQTVGSFPAFWTLGGNYEEGGGITWPYCGEIDIMEHKYGYAWTTAGALYRTDLVWDNWDAKDLGRVDSGNIGSFDDYHIYAMEWTHDKLDYYVDDRLIGHSDISDDSQWFMFHQPHYILLNQALGGAGGSVPSNMTEYTMYVDWVRVYAPQEAPSGGGTSNQIWFEDTSARHMNKWSKLGLILKFNESWNNKVVTWKSSNESIATVCGGRVDSKGVDGTCIITATTLEGNSASITVNVGSGGSSSDSTEYTTSCTSSYILDKMYPMPQNHEALPSGVTDTWATQSRWENQQRPTAIAHNCGQANCPGAVQFRALGAWANVYRVKNTGFSSNTGVEMRNIKVYGWYNGQWEKVQDLAVPSGNFYAESFSGDSNTYFSDSIKTTSTSKTIILREANKVNGENCMYHPFSDIKNFDTKYQYVYTCIDLRKVKWNESGTDDRDSSHYCASCGGDWWLAEGLTFDSSWQHNKGIAQPKIIEITKEWRRFSMTTVPQNWTNGFPQ